MTESPLPPAELSRADGDTLPADLGRLISWTLRVGVTLSAALALVGLGLLLAGTGTGFDTSVVTGAPFPGPRFLSGVLGGNGTDVLFLALLVLIATPLIRVIISVLSFARSGDRRFTALTLTVLLLLGIGVLLGATT